MNYANFVERKSIIGDLTVSSCYPTKAETEIEIKYICCFMKKILTLQSETNIDGNMQSTTKPTYSQVLKYTGCLPIIP